MIYKKKYDKVNKENIELSKNQENVNLMLKKFEEEKKEYLEKFERYQNDKIEVQNKNVEYQEQLDKLRKERFDSKKEIEELKKKNDDMAIKLNEMKILLVNKKLTKKSFKVEMIGKGKKLIEIVFQRNAMMDNYEMVIKGKNKNESEEHINLLDIINFQNNDKDKNRVDIKYIVSKIIFNFSFIIIV